MINPLISASSSYANKFFFSWNVSKVLRENLYIYYKNNLTYIIKKVRYINRQKCEQKKCLTKSNQLFWKHLLKKKYFFQKYYYIKCQLNISF